MLIAPNQSFEQDVKCERCGEKQIAPVWTKNVASADIKNLWCCDYCGHVFETSNHLNQHEPLPIELVERFVANLIIA